jgi:hypothetical protein
MYGVATVDEAVEVDWDGLQPGDGCVIKSL